MTFRRLLSQAFAPRTSKLQSFVLPLAAVMAALVVGGAMISFAGFNPVQIYTSMLEAAAGTPQGIGVSITNAIPLILAGLGVAIPFCCGLLNIGGEGQIYVGALFATLVGLGLHGLPIYVHLPLALLAGFIGGGIWGAIPGYLRSSRGLNEIIVTIMLNYIGFWIVSYLVHGPMKDPESYGYSWTMKVPVSAQLPFIIRVARIHLGIAVALVGQTSPLGVVFAGLFFGGLQNGVNTAQRSLGIPMGVALSLQGLILLFMIAGQSLTLIRWLRKKRTARRVEHSQPATLLD